MPLENVLKEELLSVNRGIVKKRKSVRALLENPHIEDGNRKIRVSDECLRIIEERCTLPLDDIYLPITFFIPAGLDEGYVKLGSEARVVELFGMRVRERNGQFWVKKYEIRKLISQYPGCFQSVIIP